MEQEELKNDSLAFEMAKQLHEQYAANDNAKTTNVIGFLAAITFIFIGFGFVYVQPYLKDTLNKRNDYQLLLLSVDVIINMILVLVSVLCVCFGYSTRRDHVVITRLRKQYAAKENEAWFLGKYDGIGKNMFKYLPDYYSIIFIFIQIFIVCLAIGCCINVGVKKYDSCWWRIAGVAIVLNLGIYICYFVKYTEMQETKKK